MSSRDTGPRPRGSFRRASAARPTATASSSCARRSAPARTSPTLPRRSPTPISAIRLATAAPLAAGPGALRDARRAAVRYPAGAADRGDAAAGRGDEARRVPRAARGRAARPARARRRGHEPRRGARSLGALALPARARSGPSSSVRRSAPCWARPGRSARPCSSRRSRSGVRRSTSSWPLSRTAARRHRPPRMRCDGRSSRCSATATGLPLVARLDRMLLGLGGPARLRVAS